MVRTFSLGSGSERKLVKLVVDGHRVGVIEGKSDGAAKRSDKELESESQARAACDKMARALISRGYLEHASTPPAPARPRAAPVGVVDLFDDEELAAPALPRLAPVAEVAPEKKKSGRKKKHRPKQESGDGLDKRVIAGAAAACIAFVAFLGYIVYDTFLVTPSVVGHWQGSRLDYEISKSLSLSQYDLTLDEQKRAVLSLQKDLTSKGTYSLKGDRLKLTLKGEEGESFEIDYKVSVGRMTMDLYDPTSGKKIVELMRDRKKASAGASAPPAIPKDLAAGAAGKADATADGRLASVPYAPPDGAFKLRHPPGWEPETGSRADNSYSWTRFTKGSAKIQVTADVMGSLVSGSDYAGQQEEGSASAPVHVAHLSNANGVSQDFSDYKESAPTLFKGSSLGEGRVAVFTASGGMFSSKIRGLRVTMLTGDRRITVLCQCPDEEFAKLKPTFLAVARSLSR